MRLDLTHCTYAAHLQKMAWSSHVAYVQHICKVCLIYMLHACRLHIGTAMLLCMQPAHTWSNFSMQHISCIYAERSWYMCNTHATCVQTAYRNVCACEQYFCKAECFQMGPRFCTIKFTNFRVVFTSILLTL